MPLRWYVVTIILRCDVAGESTTENEWTCLEQVHVLRAQDREDEYNKALTLGKSLEHSYLNYQDQIVSWSYVGLENLEELLDNVIRDGTEIWG